MPPDSFEGVHGDLKVVVLPVEGGDGEHGQLVLPGHFFQGADDAVQVLLVGEVDVHRGDDLEVVDEHHRLSPVSAMWRATSLWM